MTTSPLYSYGNKGKQGCTYNHCYEKKQQDSSSDHKTHTESITLLYVVTLSTAHIQTEHDTVLEDLIFMSHLQVHTNTCESVF